MHTMNSTFQVLSGRFVPEHEVDRRAATETFATWPMVRPIVGMRLIDLADVQYLQADADRKIHCLECPVELRLLYCALLFPGIRSAFSSRLDPPASNTNTDSEESSLKRAAQASPAVLPVIWRTCRASRVFLWGPAARATMEAIMIPEQSHHCRYGPWHSYKLARLQQTGDVMG